LARVISDDAGCARRLTPGRGLCYAPPMDDAPPDDPETPIQRALRLKRAALQARPAGSEARLRPAKGMPAGASKPWMKK
jgi:hypothetical protein